MCKYINMYIYIYIIYGKKRTDPNHQPRFNYDPVMIARVSGDLFRACHGDVIGMASTKTCLLLES